MNATTVDTPPVTRIRTAAGTVHVVTVAGRWDTARELLCGTRPPLAYRRADDEDVTCKRCARRVDAEVTRLGYRDAAHYLAAPGRVATEGPVVTDVTTPEQAAAGIVVESMDLADLTNEELAVRIVASDLVDVPAAPTADEARETIRALTWKVETGLPAELARTTHARSVARIRRELAEARDALSRAVTDLSSALQEQATEQPAESVDELAARVLAEHPRVARTLAREEERARHEAAARARAVADEAAGPAGADDPDAFTQWHECEEAMGDDLHPSEYADDADRAARGIPTESELAAQAYAEDEWRHRLMAQTDAEADAEERGETAHGLTAPPIGYAPADPRAVRHTLTGAGHTVGRSLTVAESYAFPGAVVVTVHELRDETADTVAARVAVDVTAAGYVVTRPTATVRLVYVTGGPAAADEAARMASDHLADCRACALRLPHPHAYASIIDEPPTAAELGALSVNPAAAPELRQVAAGMLARHLADGGAPELARINDPACADDVRCVDECRNDVMGEGFWPAGPAGLVSPEVGSTWDGTTIACLACGRLIDTAADKARPEPADEWQPWRSPVVGRITLPDGSEPRPGE